MSSERRNHRRSQHGPWDGATGVTGAHDTGAVPPHPPPQADVDALEAGLQRSKLRLRFTPEVERAYEQDTRANHNLRMAACNLLGGAAFQANITRDLVEMPELAPLLGPVSLWGTAFVAAASGLILWRRHSAPTWMIETVLAIGALLVFIYVAIAVHSGPDDIARFIRTGGVCLVLLNTSLVGRLQFRYSLALGMFGLLAYAFAARSHNELEALVVAGNVRLFATTLAFTLLANYVLEYRERRAFLLRALDRHSRQALSHDAAMLERLSLRDPLTGLANRRRFDTAWRTAWDAAGERAEPLAVLQVDVDFFKRYNDFYGHPAGDACLKRVADVLHRLARQHAGLAARTGGEEFALLLPERSLAAAAEIGEAVRLAVRALALSHADSAVAPCVTVSIGVAAIVPASGQDAQELLRAGDGALYDAKRQGRDRVACAPLGPAAVAAGGTAPTPPAHASSSTPAATAARPPTQALADRIEALTAALEHRLHWLRFPAAIEAAYVTAGVRQRRLWLNSVSLVGMLYVGGYVWISRPLFADVAERVVHGMGLLAACFVPLVIAAIRPMAPRLREALFSASLATLCIVEVSLLAPSQLITVYSYSLAFFLLPMFSAIVAAQPFRFSLVTSLFIWGVTVVGLQPTRSAWRLAWIDSSVVLLSGIVLSLVGGYLIDLSARRDYLLQQIADARRALLTENAATLRLLAESDPLTGLANRRKFDAEQSTLLHACAAAREPLALLIVDIDHFKRYNDRYGHPEGDACLRRVALALSNSPDDGGAPSAARERVIARLGGEEFAILIPGCDAQRALQLADALCARVRQLAIAHLDSPVAAHVTVSIGLASTVPSLLHEPEVLLRDADAALYRAKSRGRNQASI